MKTIIVRPANVYGPHDNFDVNTAMVIPSLINKFVNSKIEKYQFGEMVVQFVILFFQGMSFGNG